MTVWAWLNDCSKSAQGASVISFGIRERKPEIERMLEYMAKKRGMTADDLFKSILDGTADSSGDDPSSED
jgi:nicotinic acid phosphoribosyltransferase